MISSSDIQDLDGRSPHLLSASPRGREPRYPAGMAEPAPASEIKVPPKTPEREAEIRALLERVARGDESGTVSWEEVAAELGLPSHPR